MADPVAVDLQLMKIGGAIRKTEERLKRERVRRDTLARIASDDGFDQRYIGECLGVSQPHVSRILSRTEPFASLYPEVDPLRWTL